MDNAERKPDGGKGARIRAFFLISGGLLFAILGGVVGVVFGTNGGKGVSTPPDSPIVVRGGAMTIRTKDQTYGWQTAGSSFCTNADTSMFWISDDATLYNGSPKLPTNPLVLTSGWRVTIVGRLPSSSGSSQASTNGITLSAASAPCTSSTGSTWVTLSTIPSTNSSFYPTDPVENEEKPRIRTAKRFMDTTKGSGGAPSPCAGPNTNPNGDEDVCERASIVTLTNSSHTYTYWCTNGECMVGIGAPSKK
jgi:hypothetical protein